MQTPKLSSEEEDTSLKRHLEDKNRDRLEMLSWLVLNEDEKDFSVASVQQQRFFESPQMRNVGRQNLSTCR